MTVGAANTYTSPLNTHEAYATRTAAKDEQKTTDAATSTRAAVAGATGQAADNAVTGTKGSNLSAEVMGQLIAVTQEVGASNADSEAYDGPLSIADREYLKDIAGNPGFAASEARLFGTSGGGVFVGKTLPSVNNGFSDADRKAFLTKQAGQMAREKQVQGERTAYYESLSGQGLSPAEIFSKLLEFNANLPESHDAAIGWSESGASMSYSEYNKTRHDYLQKLLS